MPLIKTYKAEKMSTETLARKSLEVCREMLNIICDRTNKEGDDETVTDIAEDLHYFGQGHQLKISKVADSLYSSLKDVLGYVMIETAKRSDCACKFQMPKHTSYIGSIVKTVAIDVIAHSEAHQAYLASLINQAVKYKFDVTSHQFLNLYYDTILRLHERQYLFDDDPELQEVRMLLGNGNAQSSTDATGAMSVSVYPNFVVSAQHLTTRNRVIFPYLRRLLESHKAASVTKRRVDFLNEQIQPDDEIRRVFNEKYAEAMQQNTESSVNVGEEVLRAHCHYIAMNYVKENFPEEQVAQLRSYMKSDRSIASRSHKRYITIPSAKRMRTEDFIQYPGDKMDEKTFDEQFQTPGMKGDAVENVMPENIILVGNAMAQGPNIVLNVPNGPEMQIM